MVTINIHEFVVWLDQVKVAMVWVISAIGTH